MQRLKKSIISLIILLLTFNIYLLSPFFISSSSAQIDLIRVNGIAQKGGKEVKTSPTNIHKLMETYPLSTITVFNAGTLTLTTIYSNSSATIKSNPFTANSDASYAFYVPVGKYDIRFSGTGITSPFTIFDISVTNPDVTIAPATVDDLGTVKVSSTPQDADNPIAVETNDQRVTQISNYPSFTNALSTASTNNTIFKVTSDTVVGNQTVLPTTTLDFHNGKLTCTTGETLSILGPIIYKNGTKIFDNCLGVSAGQGEISFVGNGYIKTVSPDMWGAKFDSGITDNTLMIQAAFNAAGTAKGIDVEFSRTEDEYYAFSSQLSLTGFAQMRIFGAGSGRQGGDSAGNMPNGPKTRLVFTGTGTGSAIVGFPTRAITIEYLALRYSSSLYFGDLISFDNPGITGSISAQNRIQEALLGGNSATAINARSLILFRNNVEGGVRDSTLTNAVRGIIGRGNLANGTLGAGDAFSNSIAIHNVRFQNLSGYAIVNPGAQWEITGNVFEPGLDFKGRAITTEDSVVNNGFSPNDLKHQGIKVSGNGYWDSLCGGTWNQIRGQGWQFDGNYVTIYNGIVNPGCGGIPSDGKFIEIEGDSSQGTNGVNIVGNGITGNIASGNRANIYVDQASATVVSNVIFDGMGGTSSIIPPPPDLSYGPRTLSSLHWKLKSITSTTTPTTMNRDEGFNMLSGASGSFTRKLPEDISFAFMKGRMLCAMKSDSSINSITITGANGTELINEKTSYVFNRQGQTACFFSDDGTNWKVWDSAAMRLGSDAYFLLPSDFNLAGTTATDNISDVINQIKVQRFKRPRWERITKCTFSIGTAGNLMGLGIYDSSGNFITGVNSISINVTNTRVTATLSSAFIANPDLSYFAGLAADTTTATTLSTTAISTGAMDLFNKNQNFAVATNLMSAGIMPSTLGTLTSISASDSLPIIQCHN